MRRLILATALLLSGLFHTSAFAKSFAELLQRIPDSANALVMMDVDQIFNSPLAKSQNWKQTYADNYAAAPVIVPPNAKRFILGAELDIETMKPAWESASMEMGVEVSAKGIGSAVGGIVDSLSNTDVVWVKKGFCVATFSPTEVGVLSPANRQSAARWIDEGRDASSRATPYLQRAASYADGGHPEIIMALDLNNLLRPQEIRAAVESSDVLRGKDVEQVTALLSGIRGVTLGAHVGQAIRGKLIVDFSDDAQVLDGVSKPLILGVLANAGATIDEFDQWQPAVKGRRVSIEGELSAESMRRLFSLVALDAAIVDRKLTAQATDQPSKTKTGLASLRYFRSVTKYLSDIRRPSRKKRSFSQIAMWVSNYAAKIEKIPTRDVDPDLVVYADDVVYRMRDAVANIHGVSEQAADRTSQVRDASQVRVGAVPTFRRVNYGGYVMREYAPMAYANVDVGAAQQRDQIASEARARGEEIARGNIDQIEADTQAIRAKMAERYGLRF